MRDARAAGRVGHVGAHRAPADRPALYPGSVATSVGGREKAEEGRDAFWALTSLAVAAAWCGTVQERYRVRWRTSCGRPLLELAVRRLSVVREDVEVTVTTGTIKKVISDRGFGFITAEDGKEYFFHRDGLTASVEFDRLAGGERVTFDVEQSPKGARAKNVAAA